MLDFASIACYGVGTFCNAELMLHYFHTRDDLFHAVLIPVHCFESLHQARASECSLIHSWKPQLNAPWIVRLSPTSTARFAQPFTVNEVLLWQSRQTALA